MMKYQNWKKKLAVAALAATVIVTPAFAAGGLMDSTLVKGLQNLIGDVTLALTILCPLVGGAAAVGCLVAKGAAPQEDYPMWNKRLKTAIISGVGGGVVSGIITLIAGYFA